MNLLNMLCTRENYLLLGNLRHHQTPSFRVTPHLKDQGSGKVQASFNDPWGSWPLASEIHGLPSSTLSPFGRWRRVQKHTQRKTSRSKGQVCVPGHGEMGPVCHPPAISGGLGSGVAQTLVSRTEGPH